MYGLDEAIAAMTGKEIASVALANNKERLEFRFADGTGRAFTVSGDCCSSSWIEHLEMPPDVVGATLLAVEDGGSVDATDNDTLNPVRPPAWDGDNNNREHECLQVYSTTFKTTRGDIVLEFRNSSNGYYGGSLDDAGGV